MPELAKLVKLGEGEVDGVQVLEILEVLELQI